MKKLRTLISFVLMAAMMLTLIPSMGLVAMAADDVISIELTNSVIDVVSGTTSYDVAVAAKYPDNVDTCVYDIPTVTAVNTANGEVDFTQTEATAVPGTITVTAGDVAYTLNLKLVGANIYTNGGAESGCWPAHWSGKALVTTNPGKGNNAVEITSGGNYSPAGESPYKTLTGGRTYLGSQMIRTKEGSTWATVSGDVYTPNGAVFGNRDSSTFACYDANGIALPSSAPKTYAVSETTWITANKVIKMSADASIVDVYHTGAGNAVGLIFDEVFLGEIAADISITDDMAQSSMTIAASADERIFNLNAKLLNQLGNGAGLENISMTWDVKGPSDAVTVIDGVVTLPANAEAGTYEVSALADVSSFGNGQGKVRGVYTINVVDPSSLVALVNDVTFSNVVVDDFSKDVFAYSIPVPVLHTDNVDTFTYDIPKLTAFELADNNDTVEITEALDVPGTTTIKVTHDGVEKTYAFNFYLAGNNMYANGGVESGTWQINNVNNSVQTDVNPGEGNYCINIDYGVYYPDKKAEEFVGQRTYLASSMVRWSSDNTSETGKVKEEFKNQTNNATVTAVGWNEDGTARDILSYTVDKEKWLTHYRTYYLDVDASFADVYTNWSTYTWNDFTVDEYFIGELVANTIIKDSDNATSKEMFIPAVDTTINLSAERVNNLGNKAGLGTAAPTYTWSVAGNPEGVTVDNGVVTIKSNAEEGTYYVEATAPTGIANGRQVYTKSAYAIRLVDESTYFGTLTSLKVSSTDIDFDWDVYDYAVAVPVLNKNEQATYVIPKVTAVAYNDADVEITYPETIPGDITVEVENGDTYTIALSLIGENMYLNGNLNTLGEYGYPSDWWIQGGQITNKDETGLADDYYVNFYAGGQYQVFTPYPENYPTLEAGKTYIHQNMIRKFRGEINNTNTYKDSVKMRLEGLTTNANIADEEYSLYTPDGDAIANEEVTLTDDWYAHTAVMRSPTVETPLYITYLGESSRFVRFATDDFWLSELTIADIEFDADKEVLATSDEAQTVNLTAKAVNSVGNLAGIKDKHTLTFRLGNNAPEGAAVTDAGVITVPAGFKGEFEVEAVATPTWLGAAQKNYVKAYKVVVGDAAIWYEATDDGVVANLIYTGNETGYKFINAIYNVLQNGELEFVSATPVDVDGALTYAETITLNAGQVAKTFFWKWEELTPLTKSFTFIK